MIKKIIRLLKSLKCKIFVCCGSKCSLNENNVINISAIDNESNKTESTKEVAHE